jgi:large subunit ribosomal protein L22
MRGPKLNEGATMATMASGERHGTKATAKYLRSSASKARVVLDLIRGLDVKRADEVLQFTDRSIAKDVRKVLASAVANATNVDNTGSYIGDADELFVLACFADEGPTLKRFAARARGRGTRIRKRTCHITVVVARMSDQRLEVVRARAEGANASVSANRRARVERSRTRAKAAAKSAVAGDAVDESASESQDESQDDAAAQGFADVADEVEPGEGSAGDEPDAARGGSEADDEPAIEDDDEPAIEIGAYQVGEYTGSVLPDDDGNGPESHLIKGNAQSMLYHTPDSRYYKATKAEVWFDTEENAEAAGFSKPGAKNDEAESDEAVQSDEEDSTDVDPSDEGAN